MLVIIFWKHIQTLSFWNIALKLTEPKKTMYWWKIRVQIALCYQLDSWYWFILFQFYFHVEISDSTQVVLCGRQMFLHYWEVPFSERYSRQDGLALHSNWNYSWKSVKVLTASENMVSSILCFEFSCEQLVHTGLHYQFEQRLVALMIWSTPFYLLGK